MLNAFHDADYFYILLSEDDEKCLQILEYCFDVQPLMMS